MMHICCLFEMYFNEDEQVTCAEICLFASNKSKTKSCWNMFTTKIVRLRNIKSFEFDMKDILPPKINREKHLLVKYTFFRYFERERETPTLKKTRRGNTCFLLQEAYSGTEPIHVIRQQIKCTSNTSALFILWYWLHVSILIGSSSGL